MTNDVQTRGSNSLAVPNLGALAKGLRNAKTTMPSSGGKPYLKMAKDGEWSLGRNGDVRNGERALLNSLSIQSGYTCWTDYPKEERKKNVKLGDEMRPLLQGSVDPSELPNHAPWAWKQQMSVEGRFTDKEGAEFIYTASSLGGMDFFNALVDELLARIEDGEEVYIFPVVEFDSTWYDHTSWGKTYKPDNKVIGWADISGGFPDDDDPTADEDESVPVEAAEKRRPQTKPEPQKQADEGEADAPRRRRR